MTNLNKPVELKIILKILKIIWYLKPYLYMEKEFTIQQLNNKIIEDAHGFISKVIDYQSEVTSQMNRFNKDIDLMVYSN